MLIVISNRPERIERHGHLWGDFEVFTSPADNVREAHYDMAVHAVAEGWDETVRVIQDDVVVSDWPRHRFDITSYYPGTPGHTCPRAFTATPRGWQVLTVHWQWWGQTCVLWSPDWWYNTARLIEEVDVG